MIMDKRVIFDNSGGATVQIGAAARCFAEPRNAARIVAVYLIYGYSLLGADFSHAVPEPTDDELRNGGYRVWEIDIDDIYPHVGLGADFFTALMTELSM